MAKRNMKRKGQVTIFIILAILIVSGVLIFFLWVKPTYISVGGGQLNFEKCVSDVVEQTTEKLSGSAGFIDPEFSYMYQGNDVAYLCYTNLYYSTCTVQKPFLKQHFEENLLKETREKISLCYENSLKDLKNSGYEVSSGSIDIDISLEPGKMSVLVEAPTTVGAQRFTKFRVDINSPIYNILMVATSIIQYETRYGDSDVSSLMLYYPEFIVDKMKRGDGTTVYSIEDKTSKIKFEFASKSLVWPAGYGVR
jgi:hypothetical protein